MIIISFSSPGLAQEFPAGPDIPTKEQLANDDNLFISLAKKFLKWEEPADPVHIAGPIYFPDGTGFNPGYRLAKTRPLAEDYRRTRHFLEMLKPDIWLAQHNEYYDLAGKAERAKSEGVKAWIDPEGYRRFIAGKKRAFEDEVDAELGVTTSDAK